MVTVCDCHVLSPHMPPNEIRYKPVVYPPKVNITTLVQGPCSQSTLHLVV